MKILMGLFVAAFLVGELGYAEPESPFFGAEIRTRRIGNYSCQEQNWPVTWDPVQVQAFSTALKFQAERLKKIADRFEQAKQQAYALDPNNELEALPKAIDAFHSQIDNLLELSSRLYGTVISDRTFLRDLIPSAFIVFAGREYQASVGPLFKLGGSVMFGVVIIPVKVRCALVGSADAPVETYRFDSTVIAIPSGNFGFKSGLPFLSPGGDKYRGGVGFVWGKLNRSADLVGVTGGTSTTLAFGAGVNVKLMALLNLSGLANTVALIGYQSNGQAIDAETHFNISGIVNGETLLKPLTKLMTDPPIPEGLPAPAQPQ